MRLEVGTQTPGFTVETLRHGTVSLDDLKGKRLWLQFHRFAGCPFCSLQVRELIERHQEVELSGLTHIAFFHSPRSQVEKHMGTLHTPFLVAADPERVAYRAYGVQQSWRGLLSRRYLTGSVKAIWHGLFANPIGQNGGLAGLPADFLVDEAGVIRYSHYGEDAADMLSVEDVVRLVHRFEP
ncbi:MAG: peroxiredoxin-like family protein [Acidimicrobiia bacterium]